jgi:putative membrane protein
MHMLLHFVVLTVTVLALARVVPGVRVTNNSSAALVAVVFGVLNFALGWLIKAVLFVPALLTLGLLFLFVPFIVNTIVLWLTDKVLHAFEIRDLQALLISSGAITLVNGLLHFVIR